MAARAIVREHNTHVGDARATDIKEESMVIVGQLLRERHSSQGVFITGFGTYGGSVTASPEWGADFRITNVPSVMSSRYDCFIFVDETSALHPLVTEKILY